MKKIKDWKDTLLLPKTEFKMKAKLNEKEKYFANFWNENKIYQKVLEKNKNSQVFILHDGPPYANGDLHLGHALNKILKDFIIRYKNLKGFYAPFIPGWDTHGLPIENTILKLLHKSAKELDPIVLRKKAQEFAKTQVSIQKNQFLKMQLFSDFKKVYLTFDKEYELKQLKFFKKLVSEKLIYKGLKPIYWSPSSLSALAEAEVEYKNIKSPQIIVAFKLLENSILPKNTYLLIMTTTPWTLIANAAIAINKNIEYILVEVEGRNYIVAKQLLDNIANDCKWEKPKIIKSISSQQLQGLKYKRPFNKKWAKVVLGEHVNLEAGTGLVHIAPLFGEDDFKIGQKENLDLIMHVNDDGTFNKKAGDLSGMFYLDANKEIGLYLESQKLLLSLKFILHSFPHDWRTDKPIIYRATPQWFFSISKLKSKIITALKSVKSYPDWGVSRLKEMIETRQDWTISRQRNWGVPIIAFYDQENKVVVNDEILDYVIAKIQKHGTNIWWEKTAEELLPKKYRKQNLRKEKDIMDVWFDSGISHLFLNIQNHKPPYDLYLEGTDQYRGWFNSSLITSVAYWNQSPFKMFISHGFVLDAKMEKMSKSKGNTISPFQVIKNYGADILRLWVANSEYTSDVAISDSIIKQTVEIYRRIRNTIRFMLGNLFDFDYVKDKKELKGIHALIEEQLNNLIQKISSHYEKYKFINIVKDINNFLIQLSSFYLDYAKDILYTKEYNCYDRRAIQTNIFKILDFLIIALAPIIPTTSEEVYQLFKKNNKTLSVHQETFSFQGHNKKDEQEKWEWFFKLRSKVYVLLEEAKKNHLIQRSNEAVVYLPEDEYGHYAKKTNNLHKLLMVGKIKISNKLFVKPFKSKKCNRCWNHFESLYDDEICQECYLVLKKIK